MSDKIIQSYVFRDGRAWFVSTIERDYDTYCGTVRGPETMVWDWNPATRERSDSIVYHGDEGFDGHLLVCRSLHEHGVANAEFYGDGAERAARLAAAAPDLLEACKEAVRYVQRASYCRGDMADQTCDRMKEAIAKAEGK